MARYSKGKWGVRATGLENLTKDLQKAAQEMNQAAAYGQYEAAQNIMLDAKSRAPVLTGALRDSGYVAAPDLRGGGSRVEMGFGGYAAPYTARQHETHATKSQFLSNAIDAGLAMLRSTVAKYVAQALRGRRVRLPLKRVPSTPTEVGTKPHWWGRRGGGGE